MDVPTPPEFRRGRRVASKDVDRIARSAHAAVEARRAVRFVLLNGRRRGVIDRDNDASRHVGIAPNARHHRAGKNSYCHHTFILSGTIHHPLIATQIGINSGVVAGARPSRHCGAYFTCRFPQHAGPGAGCTTLYKRCITVT